MKCENLHLITSFFYFILDTQQKQSNGSSTESHKNLEKNGRGAQAAGIISIVILIGLLTVLTCWLRRQRSSKLASYTGNEILHLHDQIWRILFHLPKHSMSSSALLGGMSKLPAHNSRKSCYYQKPGVPWGGHVVPQDMLFFMVFCYCAWASQELTAKWSNSDFVPVQAIVSQLWSLQAVSGRMEGMLLHGTGLESVARSP